MSFETVKAAWGGKTFWQLREISNGDGGGNGTLTGHFGLGDATIIDTLRIEWPSGIVQELHGVSMNQSLTVTEPAPLQALGAGVLRIQSWKGMAFEVQASTDLDQWSPPNHRDQSHRHAGVHRPQCSEQLAAFLPNGASVTEYCEEWRGTKRRMKCRCRTETTAKPEQGHFYPVTTFSEKALAEPISVLYICAPS